MEVEWIQGEAGKQMENSYQFLLLLTEGVLLAHRT